MVLATFKMRSNARADKPIFCIASGIITESKAQKETYLLNSVLKAIELTDLDNRLQNIENILKER